MNITMNHRTPVLWVLLGLCSLLPLAAGAADAGLSREQVRRWMQVRIQTYELQQEFRRNADQYEDVPRAFYQARDAYLDEIGYPRPRFEADEMRIYNALNAIENRERLAAEGAQRDRELAEAQAQADPMADPEFRRMLQELRAVGLSEEQARQLVEAQRQMPQALAQADAYMDEQEQALLDASRPDWDGVRPWLDELEQLMDWLAGNTGQPPTLD